MAKWSVKAVIHWVDDKVSIEDICTINNEEDRYVDAPTTITKGSKSYKAVVRLISSDIIKSRECEDKVSNEIDDIIEAKRQQVENDKRGRSIRHKRNLPAAASTSQLARALGERPRLDTSQAEITKQRAKVRKTMKQAQEAAQDELDNDVFHEDTGSSGALKAGDSAKRNLFGNDPAVMLVKNYDDATDENSSDSSDPEIVDEERGVPDSGKREADEKKEQGTSSVKKNNVSKDCCSHCKELSQSLKGSAISLLKCLQKIHSPSEQDPEVEYVEVLPVPPGTASCELSKKSGVIISVSDKNLLKSTGNGDPSAMARQGLVVLYGKDILECEDVCVKGSRKGSKAFRPEARSALLAFVNRNRNQNFKPLNETDFNRILNRKKNQIKRVSKTPPAASNSKKKRKDGQTAMEESHAGASTSTAQPASPKEASGRESLKHSSPGKQKTPTKAPETETGGFAVAATSPWKVKSPGNAIQNRFTYLNSACQSASQPAGPSGHWPVGAQPAYQPNTNQSYQWQSGGGQHAFQSNGSQQVFNYTTSQGAQDGYWRQSQESQNSDCPSYGVASPFMGAADAMGFSCAL